MVTKQSPTTQAVLETLRRRAEQHGDPFEADKRGRYRVRCFEPDKHTNGDSHPSALYTPGKYVV